MGGGQELGEGRRERRKRKRTNVGSLGQLPEPVVWGGLVVRKRVAVARVAAAMAATEEQRRRR